MHLIQFGSTLRGMGDSKPKPQLIPYGKRLAAVRKALGQKQQAAAASAGVGVTTWNNYELGIRPVPVVVLGRYSRAMECPGLPEWVTNESRALLPQRVAEAVARHMAETAPAD